MVTSTNTQDYPDLDLRPAEMQRSTMFTWILECPHCGYIAGTFRNKPQITEEFLKSESYMTCDACFFNLLHCAWDCDDKNDENAVKMRKLALDQFDDLKYEDEEKKNYLAIKANLLRRSRQFDQLIEEFSDITIGDEIYDNVIQFQIEKALEKDTKCYTVGDTK